MRAATIFEVAPGYDAVMIKLFALTLLRHASLNRCQQNARLLTNTPIMKKPGITQPKATITFTALYNA